MQMKRKQLADRAWKRFRMRQVKYLRRHPKEMARNKWKQDKLLLAAVKNRSFCQSVFGV